MKLFRHILPVILSVFLVASCVMDEMFSGPDQNEGKEVVMTFRPKFEDFGTVTKAIGDGTKVDRLMVQVYADGANDPEWCEEYDKDKWSRITIPFLYGKTYKVYFWAYCSTNNPYTIAENGLQDGVTVQYPQSDVLGFDALEHLDAFCAVETINLSDNIPDNTRPSLTRPFAQVNLVADKTELQTAKATKVVFTIKNVANQFKAGSSETSSTSDRTFVFESQDNFKDNQIFDGNNVYLGTTYLFVPSSGSLEAEVTLYDQMGNKLKGPSTVAIPLASNRRTNLVFSGVEPAWNNNAVIVPDEESDGWIHISTPEQLAALLISDRTDAKVHICNDIDMGGMPSGMQVGKSYTNLTLYGGGLDAGNQTGEGSVTIKNFTAPAFLGTATNLAVSNLALDNVNVTSADGHVGTLVNTLKGTSTFTNVTVSNSSATTTNGAAGGIVGYIVRVSEKDRAENLEVKFDGCRIVGSEAMNIATGSLAEGKFVGLLSGYDNGEKLVFTDCSADYKTTVDDYASRYIEGNESTWQSANDYSIYDGFLGDEKYLRAKVYYGGEDETNRFCPKWDGKTNVEPIYEDSSKKVAQIWSAFDLAYLQGKDMTTINIKSNVDMVGICDDCREARSNPCSIDLYLNNSSHICPSCPDELYACKDCIYFTPIKTINNIDGDNHTIYNLNIQQQHNEGSSWGAGFVNRLNSGTVKNLTFEKAYIKCIDTHTLRNDPKNGGNAYAGTLASRTNDSATVTIANVHANNGYITAISKFGGLLGYVHGSLNASKCSVNNYTIENNKINVINTYEKTFSKSGVTASVTAEFYTEGEAGGFVGFLTSGNSMISDCSVNNVTMRCYGQDNQTKIISGKLLNIIPFMWPYNIAGRHVNAFIGDIRTTNKEEITITNCSATYNCPSGFRYDINSTGKGEIIGCCYIVGVADIVGDKKGKVMVDGESMNFVGD